MDETNHFAVGLFWGVLLSIPLWISFFGWVELLHKWIQSGWT